MVVFGVKCNKENETLKKLIEEFNIKLNENDKMIYGKVYWLTEDVLIFYIKNYVSPVELPVWITFQGIKFKWKRKGYKDFFKLVDNQKILDLLRENNNI